MADKNRMLRIVIDTNLVISGIISPNTTPSKLLAKWYKDEFNWIISEELFEEITEVLNRDKIKKKYQISDTESQTLLDLIIASALFVTPISQKQLPIHSRDKKDDMLLACAFGGNCDYLITGDNDLLVLQGKPVLGKLRIIKTTEFLNINE